MGCGYVRPDRHRGHDRRAAGALPREPGARTDRRSKPHHGHPTDDSLRDSGKPESVAESVAESFSYCFNQPLTEPVSYAFADSLPMSIPESVTQPDRGCLPDSK
jgi:hypothetical protein